MTLYVVRHAEAGRRSEWNGPDETRPLSDKGREQAVALAQRLVESSPSKLISSPATRCIQTLEPLAQATGLQVQIDECLKEAGDIADMLKLCEDAFDSTVICSHGDMIPELVRLLERCGMKIDSRPNWQKASVWVLERTKNGFTTAVAWV